MRNQSIARAQNVWGTDTVPSFLEVLSVITTKGTPGWVGNTVVVYIGTLEPYGTEGVTISIRTWIRAGTPAGMLMNNLAGVTADGGDDQDTATVRVRGGGEEDEDEGPPPAPTPTPEVVAVSMLPETGGRPSLSPSFPGLSLVTMVAVLVLLALLRREGRHSDN